MERRQCDRGKGGIAMSFFAGFAAGLSVGKKKFGGSGGDDDKWEYPQCFPKVSKPAENELKMIVYISERYINQPSITVSTNSSHEADSKTVISWGDGSSSAYPGTYDLKVTHFYDEAGYYVITCSAPISVLDSHDTIDWVIGEAYDSNVYLSGSGFPAINFETQTPQASTIYSDTALVYALFIGSKVAIDQSFNTFKNLTYVYYTGGSINEARNLPCSYGAPRLQKIESDERLSDEVLANNHSLTISPMLYDVDFWRPIPEDYYNISASSGDSSIPASNINIKELKLVGGTQITISNLGGLKKLTITDFTGPNLSISNCPALEEVHLPDCNELNGSIYSNPFQGCPKLKILETSLSGCNYNGNTFSENPLLYPKPQ